MREYCYICPSCGSAKSDLRETEKRNELPVCSCGSVMERNLQAELSGVPAVTTGEIVSVNAGISVLELKEGNRDLQEHGLGDCHYDREGNLHAPNRKRYLAALEHKGLFNADEVRSPKRYSGRLHAGRKILR